jgi:hypothetical protein
MAAIFPFRDDTTTKVLGVWVVPIGQAHTLGLAWQDAGDDHAHYRDRFDRGGDEGRHAGDLITGEPADMVKRGQERAAQFVANTEWLLRMRKCAPLASDEKPTVYERLGPMSTDQMIEWVNGSGDGSLRWEIHNQGARPCPE